jgi:cytoskeletal protein CcmA (bactofilin family)
MATSKASGSVVKSIPATVQGTFEETAVNLISEKSTLEGTLRFSDITRFHGRANGSVQCSDGSTFILGDTGVIEGTIQGDTIIVNGFVRGDIEARTKVLIGSAGRVTGNIKSPSIQIETGAFFEGETRMHAAASAT